MQRNACRYELLQDDETEPQAPPVAEAVVLETPEDTPAHTMHNAANSRDERNFVEPPAYSVAVDLPTYDEYERLKKLEDEEKQTVAPPVNEISAESRKKVDDLIGTDGMFLLGFVFAFLFNWLGLLIAFCLMHTCAGRFGALSGFGLSIVKWVAIVKRNNWGMGVAEADSWIWWLLICFGMLLAFSGSLQYIRLKFLWLRARGVSTGFTF